MGEPFHENLVLDQPSSSKLEADSFSEISVMDSQTNNKQKNKNTVRKTKPTAVKFTGARFRERLPHAIWEDNYISEKLTAIKGPTSDLSPIKQDEKKFSGRARLYIGNLSPKVTETDLKNLFQKYGESVDIFINQAKSFGFIKMDYCSNAERAKTELNGYNYQGRLLVVRFAHPAAIRVKNLTMFVSNELLHMAFSVFGAIERCYIIIDDHGKHQMEGVVEYVKKSSAAVALKRVSEGCYFITSALKPVIVEEYEPPWDCDGFTESMIRKTSEYYQEREIGPRFAVPGSFEFDYAKRWKDLHQKYKQKVAALKTELFFEEQKLETDMRSAQYDHETQRLKEMLRIREMDRERIKQEWEARQRHLDEQCVRERQKFIDEPTRLHHQDTLFHQANQLSTMLDHEEQQLQEQWHLTRHSTDSYTKQRPKLNHEMPDGLHYWRNLAADENYVGSIKRPRH